VQQGCVYLSLLVLLACGPMLSATRQRRPLLLTGVVLAGVSLNAAVLGVLSAVHDRYQSRVMWLLPLAAFVAVRALLARSRLAGGPEGVERAPDAGYVSAGAAGVTAPSSRSPVRMR
jgi:hypothetical protein